MISRYSIAVLPFVNMSSDPENEYFSDGITEEIINALSKIEGLHVTARTSSFMFKNQNTDVREVGEKLNVALILEGSIRKSEKTIRITAQLTQTANGFHVWSDTWDRKLENIFILQDEIAGLIAEKIGSDLKPTRHPDRHVVKNTDAIDAYLRANHILATWDFSRSQELIMLFEKAIELDPGLIKAYIGLSNASTWLGSTGYLPPDVAQRNIEGSIRKVLELDPQYPDVYSVLASRDFWINWDIASALININNALGLRPGSPEYLISKGLFLASAGDVEQALDYLFQGDRLDPYASNIKSTIGMIYGYINEDVKALEYIEENIRIAPYWEAQYMFKVESLCRLKRYEEAWRTIEEIASREQTALSLAELKTYYFASRNEKSKAIEEIRRVEEERNVPRKTGDPDSALIAQFYMLLGETEKALDYFEKGVAERAAPLLFHRINSHWDKIRNHPRYQKAIGVFRYPEKEEVGQARKTKYSRSALPAEEANRIVEKLGTMMKEQKPWLNPTLNLSDLAEAVDISTHMLSQLLNEHIGSNFYDFVNSFRLTHLLQVYDKPEYQNYKLLALAYECGFNSKTTFNTYFRKVLHTTPSEYFKKNS